MKKYYTNQPRTKKVDLSSYITENNHSKIEELRDAIDNGFSLYNYIKLKNFIKADDIESYVQQFILIKEYNDRPDIKPTANTLEKLILNYGFKIGTEKFNQKRAMLMGESNPSFGRKDLSPFSRDFVGYKGLNADEVTEKIEEVKNKKSESVKTSDKFSNRKNYWINLGYSEEEAEMKVSERQTTFSLSKCIDKHGEEVGNIIFQTRQEKWQISLNNKTKDELDEINRKKNPYLSNDKQELNTKIRKTKVERGICLPDDRVSEYELYKRKVWSVTNGQDLHTLTHFEKRGRTEYHLDHKFSIKEGFLNNVDPKVIGSLHNLEMIPNTENCTKQSKCSIELNELLRLL